ncbi:MAG: hypothetical protein ACI8RD_012696, partial [Bacillariaceae sp.]
KLSKSMTLSCGGEARQHESFKILTCFKSVKEAKGKYIDVASCQVPIYLQHTKNL